MSPRCLDSSLPCVIKMLSLNKQKDKLRLQLERDVGSQSVGLGGVRVHLVDAPPVTVVVLEGRVLKGDGQGLHGEVFSVVVVWLKVCWVTVDVLLVSAPVEEEVVGQGDVAYVASFFYMTLF